MCRTFFLFALPLLAACGPPLSSDENELRNIRFSNQVPKSSPAQIVKALETFCLSSPPTYNARKTLLRTSGYVPTAEKRPAEPQVFFVDDRRPAVVIGDTICSVRALSRTGQSTRLTNYIKGTFPDAKVVSSTTVAPDIEEIWAVDTPLRVLIATERGSTIDGLTTFSVSVFGR